MIIEACISVVGKKKKGFEKIVKFGKLALMTILVMDSEGVEMTEASHIQLLCKIGTLIFKVLGLCQRLCGAIIFLN